MLDIFKRFNNLIVEKMHLSEGFGDFVKKGVSKIKSFFKNMAIKINHFIAMFDKNGKVIEATSPYTSLNYISNGNVPGVTAFTAVKNEFIDESVQSTASIVESPEYYGIIDENSIEYKNYLTMIEMINEHCAKYGDKLNEARVGFSAASGGLQSDNTPDITTSQFKKFLDIAIRSTPGEMTKQGFDEDEDVHGNHIMVVCEEELIDLFEALEYFKLSDNSLSIPAIDDINDIISILEDENEAKALFETDIFRYQIVGIIHNLAFILGLDYTTAIEEAYNIGKDTFEDRYTSTLEETEGIPIIEACATKTPALIRDIPVFEEWLEDGVNVYKAKDIEVIDVFKTEKRKRHKKE